MKDTLLRLWRRRLLPVVRRPVLKLTANGTVRWHRAELRVQPFTGYCVYRKRNAHIVLQLIQSAPEGSKIHLHALDEVAIELAEFTRSSGSGARVPLLNQLLGVDPPSTTMPVVLFDDDVSFVDDAVGVFCALALQAGADVAQPAHADGSQSSFRVVRVDTPSTVRLVRFVESGPVVALSPNAAARIIPFPDDLRMGWGMDIWWSALQEPPLRLGVVDATPVVHHGAVGVDYDNADEQRILNKYLKRAGLTTAHELDTVVGLTWRPWQRVPKWLRL